MKKFGKFLVFSTIIGAAAGAYIYYQKKKNEQEYEEDDVDAEEDTTSDCTSKKPEDRSYVTLDRDAFNKEEDAVNTEGIEKEPSKTEEFFDDEDTSSTNA